MELNELRKLVRLMQRAELSELEIDDANQGLRVHLKRAAPGSGDAGLAPVLQVMPGAGMPAAAPVGLPPSAAAIEEGGTPPGTTAFTSPMVGTFYVAASPDSDAFVEVGSRVTEDSVLCIVEAMKVMNEIKAEMRGEVLEILVENGEPVEFGQPLFLLKV